MERQQLFHPRANMVKVEKESIATPKSLNEKVLKKSQGRDLVPQIRDFKFCTPERKKIDPWKGNFFLEDSSYA